MLADGQWSLGDGEVSGCWPLSLQAIQMNSQILITNRLGPKIIKIISAMSKDQPTTTSAFMARQAIVALAMLGANIYLRTTFAESSKVEVSQESMACLHVARDLRLSEKQRKKYESTKSCPIEYFEHAHFKYENKHMGPRYKSALLLAIDYWDKSGEFEGKNMKLSLHGQVYMVPKENNKPVYAMQILERPISWKFKSSEASGAVAGRKLSSLNKITQIDMMTALDYEFKVNRFELQYEMPGISTASLFSEDLRLAFSLYRIDTLTSDLAESLEKISRPTSLVWFAVCFLVYWANSRRFRYPGTSNSMFKFMVMSFLLAELPGAEKLVTFMAFKHDIGLNLLRRLLLKVGLGLACGFFVLSMTLAWRGFTAKLVRGALLIVISIWTLVHYLAGLDLLNEATEHPGRLGLYKKLDECSHLLDLVLTISVGAIFILQVAKEFSKDKLTSISFLSAALWTAISIRLQAASMRPLIDAEDLVAIRVNLMFLVFSALTSMRHLRQLSAARLLKSDQDLPSDKIKKETREETGDGEEDEQPLR